MKSMISFGSNLLKFTMFNRPPLATTQNNEIAIPIPTSPMVYGTLVLEENNAAPKIMAKKMRIRYSEVEYVTTTTTIIGGSDAAIKNNHFNHKEFQICMIMIVIIALL